MGWLTARTPTADCWYCHSTLRLCAPSDSNKGKRSESNTAVAVGTVHDFWCGSCGCWNRRDHAGEVLPDPRGMELDLSKPSTSRSSTPTRASSTTPFCRTCLSNQSLQIHLLASFPDSSPSSLHSFDDPHLMREYRNSLHSRYPLVCASCTPEVERVIRDRDYKSKSTTLGWRLQKSRPGGRVVGRETSRANGWKWWVLGVAWRVRGVAWWASHVCCIAAATAPWILEFVERPVWFDEAKFLAPHLAVLSFLWAFWDPTWDRARKERARGRKPDVVGRSLFIGIQLVLYFFRIGLATTLSLSLVEDVQSIERLSAISFLIFLSALLASCFVIRLKQPLSIRLTSSHRSLSPSVPHDPLAPLASLSLSPFGTSPSPRSLHVPTPPSNNPIRKRTSKVVPSRPPQQPIFGVASVPRSTLSYSSKDQAKFAHSFEHDIIHDETSMDWDASPPEQTTPSSTSGWDDFVLAPQRLFAPQDSSGLEGMFAKSLRVGEVERKGWWQGWGRKEQ